MFRCDDKNIYNNFAGSLFSFNYMIRECTRIMAEVKNEYDLLPPEGKDDLKELYDRISNHLADARGDICALVSLSLKYQAATIASGELKNQGNE